MIAGFLSFREEIMVTLLLYLQSWLFRSGDVRHLNKVGLSGHVITKCAWLKKYENNISFHSQDLSTICNKEYVGRPLDPSVKGKEQISAFKGGSQRTENTVYVYKIFRRRNVPQKATF